VNLLVDIGNSSIKWACWRERLQEGGSMPLAPPPATGRLAAAWAGLEKPESVYVANVAGAAAAEEVAAACRGNWALAPVFLEVMKECHGLVIAYDDAGRLGTDRWLAMLAGWTAYRSNLCVVDCGSAVTVDIVLEGGRHAGGYIIPGAHLMQDMLVRAAKGIRAEPGAPAGAGPGVSTESCLRNGTHLAVAALIDRVMTDCRSRYADDFLCLITGGGAALTASLVSVPCKQEPDLVFRGIAVAAGLLS
jgi:type III pantothenate kinase